MAAVLLHILIIGCTVSVTARYRRNVKEDPSKGGPLHFERYFTTLSNQLSALASLLYLVFLAAGGLSAIPETIRLLLHVATVAVMVTFLTVMLFLGRLYGYKAMLSGTELYMHLLGPLFAFAAHLFFSRTGALPGIAVWLGALPTLLYGAVYLWMVVIRGKEQGGWEDFYGFNQGGRWPVSVTVMLLASLLLSFVIFLLHNLFAM